VIRLCAGTHGGRVLRAPPGLATRPTGARVRKALFDILGAEIVGARVADLFAGSGALGLEALSRGAATADLFESSRPALATLRANVDALGLAPRAAIIPGALPASLASGPPWDLVLLDPPWRQALEAPVLTRLLALGRLAPDARVLVEHDARDETPEAAARALGLAVTDARTYGDTGLLFLALAAPTQA
jgi:16S rRNA (guanine966-N2)-methyltransferase